MLIANLRPPFRLLHTVMQWHEKRSARTPSFSSPVRSEHPPLLTTLLQELGDEAGAVIAVEVLVGGWLFVPNPRESKMCCYPVRIGL